MNEPRHNRAPQPHKGESVSYIRTDDGGEPIAESRLPAWFDRHTERELSLDEQWEALLQDEGGEG